MATLSTRAINYLNTLKRATDWMTTADSPEKYLSRYRLEQPDRLLQIQQDYSGYTFVENANPDYTIRLYFLSDNIIRKNQKIYYTTINDKATFSFDNSKTEPNYLLTENGSVWYWDDAVNQYFCLYETIETMIEIQALEQEYQYYQSSPVKYLAKEKSQNIINHMNDHYAFLPECSDKYQYYWLTDFDLIRITYNDYEEEYALHISSISPYNSQLILDGLKQDNLYL